MPNYRDYGIIAEEGAIAPSVAVDTTKYTDVYKATHDSDGNRLSYAKRSFISFTYGGKHIEDFGVIAITEGDRLTHPAYADFTDIVSTPEVYDGQLYWDTHHKANTWELKLATDAMTEENLTNFKNWFKPGVIRELILAEHANRAILARVAATPSISMLPFEDNVATNILGVVYNVKTTLYKGEITLNFVMDYPFWYAKKNSIDLFSSNMNYIDGADYGNLNMEDNLKVALEDNLLININRWNEQSEDGYYDTATGEKADGSNWTRTKDCIAVEPSTNYYFYWDYPSSGSFGAILFYDEDKTFLSAINTSTGIINAVFTTPVDCYYITFYARSAWFNDRDISINYPSTITTYVPYVDNVIPFIGDEVTEGVTIGSSTPTYTYMYYAGNAPCHPIIEFDLIPRIDLSTGYINSPHNSIGGGGTYPYNYIRFKSENEYDLNITTVGIYSSYNYARQILSDYADGISWEELRVAFRDNIKHYDVRAFMMRLIDKYRSTSQSESITSTEIDAMKEDMLDYLRDPNNTEVLASAHYVIDCENGRATIAVNHCTLTYDEVQENWNLNYTEVVEDAGDMLKSKYLELEDRNYLTSNHTIGDWEVNHKYGYQISTNFPTLSNFKVSYKNMYY